MVMAVVQADDAPKITEALVNTGHRVTRIATTGGWLRRENVSLLLGVEDERVDEVLLVLQQSSQRRKTQSATSRETPDPPSSQETAVEVGGAIVFVLDVEQFEHY
ncbi:MAG: cyclic-di-AMP receptor [Chloroflexi bacterium]|nr:cyclic-di-AMP receptor [Chloroflexota bacterium]